LGEWAATNSIHGWDFQYGASGTKSRSCILDWNKNKYHYHFWLNFPLAVLMKRGSNEKDTSCWLPAARALFVSENLSISMYNKHRKAQPEDMI
jgi:hypothetical protein